MVERYIVILLVVVLQVLVIHHWHVADNQTQS